jgi:excinuclease ABC subunit A
MPKGQRRYVETLSAYARQFLDQMERPDVDAIDGLSPAISIEQKTTSAQSALDCRDNYRDLRLFAPALLLHRHAPLPKVRPGDHPAVGGTDRGAVAGNGPAGCRSGSRTGRVMLLAPLVRGRKGEFKKELEKLAQHGFTRARIDGELRQPRRRDQARQAPQPHHRGGGGPPAAEGRNRAPSDQFRRGCHEARARDWCKWRCRRRRALYSSRMACPECGINVPQLEPRSFSASTACTAPARSATASARNTISTPPRLWWTGRSRCWTAAWAQAAGRLTLQAMLKRAAEENRFDLAAPFEQLPAETAEPDLLYGPEKAQPARLSRAFSPFYKQTLEEVTTEATANT